jgi:hypothetical protein
MLKTIADLLNGEEDLGEETWNILHNKFMHKSLAIAFTAKAVYRDLVCTIAAMQKRVDAYYNT